MIKRILLSVGLLSILAVELVEEFLYECKKVLNNILGWLLNIIVKF